MDAFAKSTEFIRGNTFLKRGHLQKALDFPARKWDTRLARRHSSTCRAGRWRLLTANLNFPYGAPGFGREFPYVTRKKQAGTGWFQPVFCGAVSLAACRLPCVGTVACRASGATVCYAWGTVDCHASGASACRASGATVFHVLGITDCHTSGAALAGRIGGGLPGTGGDDRRRAPGRVCCLQGIWPSGCMPLDGVRPFRSRTARSAPSTAAGNTA